ncbi:MAG: hypothetical protein AVDCRST_MAG64-865, partial [uncultured Phycisphaerae bacterium]
ATTCRRLPVGNRRRGPPPPLPAAPRPDARPRPGRRDGGG